MLAVAHALGNGRHCTRLVVERQPHVVGSIMPVELGPFVRLELGGRSDKWRHDQPPGDIENIACDG